MCGIVGYVGENSASPILIDGLKKLEYRGYDSAGIAVSENGKTDVVKTKGRIKNLEEKLEEVGGLSGTVGIGHTRWATHGAPTDVNAHPHKGGNGRITLVHNGIIENYIELKTMLQKGGYVFVSETDTEVLAHLFDYYYKGDLLDAMVNVMKTVRGSYAVAILADDKPGTIIAARKDSPLIVGLGDGENFLASDIPAVLKYTRDCYLLEDNQIAVLTKDNVTLYDTDKNVVKKDVYHVTWDVEAAEKCGYEHFMLKEIHEQPAAITATVSPRVENGMPDLRIPELSDEKLRSIKNIHLVACGTAMHAGMVGKTAIERLARVPAEVDIASEFRYRDPILNPNDLVIIISQSGETSDTLAALKLAKSRGVPVLAIVNVVGSSIARAADYVLYTYAGPEIAVASTKAYICLLYTSPSPRD